MSGPVKIKLLAGIAVLFIFTVFLLKPIPQDPAYHLFADQRTLFGIPNFWNVVSNVPYPIFGMMGLALLYSGTPAGGLPALRAVYLLFFTGVFLVGFGSAYYHLDPSNASLVWDRLPMTIAFMAFFAIIVGEYISVRAGKALLWPLVFLGMASVIYWHYTEQAGRGDLRPYAIIQFLPMLLIPLILLSDKPSLQPGKYIWWFLAAYLLAKVTEYFDTEIFKFHNLMSGHALKHVISALGPWFFYLALKQRVPKSG